MNKHLLIGIVIILMMLAPKIFANNSMKEIIKSNDRTIIWEDRDFRNQIEGVVGNGFLYSMDYSKTGNRFLLTSSFGLEIYNNQYRLTKRIFSKDLVVDACFSPDGKYVATISKDALKVWDINRGTVREVSKNDMIPRQIAFDSTGEYVAIAGHRFDVKLINIRTGSREKILKHKSFVTSIAFHPTEPVLVSGSRDETVRIFSFKTRVSRVLAKPKDEIVSLTFSPDGSYLFIATKNGSVQIMNFKSNKMSELELDVSHFQAMCISPDNKYFAGYTLNNIFVIWDLQNDELVKKINPQVKTPSRYLNNKSVVFNSTRNQVAYINEKNQLAIVSLPTGKLSIITDHSAFGGFSLSENGKYMVCTPNQLIGNNTRFIKLNKALHKSEVFQVTHPFLANSSAFHPTNKTFLLGGQGRVGFYDMNKLKEIVAFKNSKIGNVYGTTISPDGYLAAVSTSNSNVFLFDLKKRRIKKILEFSGPPFAITFSNSSRYLILGHSDLEVYDIRYNKSRSLYAYIGGTNTISANSKAEQVVIGDFRKYLHLINIRTGHVRSKKIRAFGKPPVSFSSDGRYVAFGGFKTVGVWDPYLNKAKYYRGYKSYIEAVAFSKNGKYIYSLGKEDGLIIITKVK